MTATVLDQMAIFHVDFDIWTGKARLTAKDLRLGTDGEIPPASLATLGSKNICDPALLRDFGTIKQRMVRYMQSVGMRFMNGYAVPISRLDEVSKELIALRKEFYRSRDAFLHSYDNAVSDWCASNPEWANIIRDGVMSRDRVSDRLGMDWEVFQITNGDVQASGTHGVENKARKLGGELLQEVIQTAAETYSTHLSKPTLRASVRVRKPLKEMRDKVAGLSFLDSRFNSLVQLMGEALRFFPEGSKEPVEGEGYFRISAVIQILADEKKVEDFVKGDTSVDSVAKSLQQNAPSEPPRKSAPDSSKQSVKAQPEDLLSTPPADEEAIFADLDEVFRSVSDGFDLDAMSADDPAITAGNHQGSVQVARSSGYF